jgi:antibiotic biosynthesis monooxygenase (ABM) superfamily enzyme
MSADQTSSAREGRVTIVTQTRVQPDAFQAFASWQEGTSKAIAAFPGFLEQTVIPPNPPQQVDWVILQRFASQSAALAWLNSPERLARVQAALPMLVGNDDVHLIKDEDAGALPAPVSIVISTNIKPGQEAAYRRWEQRIAAAQTKAPGFQGYRFEPPIPGIQEDWLSILRFDSDANLQAWLDSPERQALLREAGDFMEKFHTRVVRTGFDQWFPSASDGAASPAAWKQNMIVLLLLYPIVFLFSAFVQTPLLMNRAGLAFPIALLIGNAVSVILLNYLIPPAFTGFAWWLRPTVSAPFRSTIGGTVLITFLYGVLLLIFTRLF